MIRSWSERILARLAHVMPGLADNQGTGGDHQEEIDRGIIMLVLSRKKDEKIVIGDSITLMVIEIRGDKVRLGIDAPRDVAVHREEVYEAIKREAGEQQKTECRP